MHTVGIETNSTALPAVRMSAPKTNISVGMSSSPPATGPPRWRKMDSNPRSPERETTLPLPKTTFASIRPGAELRAAEKGGAETRHKHRYLAGR
jgi:hypothetical protein